MKVQGDILVTSSKGDNFKVRNVTKIHTEHGKAIIIESVDELNITFDKLLLDRSWDLTNVEVEDIGF
jgi:hypothetical protein